MAELCREHRMSKASIDKSRAKYGGMAASLFSQMRAMDRADGAPLVQARQRGGSRRLKRMHADLSIQADLLKEALGKK